MKTLILDGSHANDPMAERIHSALQKNIQQHSLGAETIVLREQKIGNCAGDFFCWVRSPGVCNIDDANREIAAKIMHSDLVIYLSPITFGGYSSALKRMQDHQIQNISPFFTSVRGEIHHQKRYSAYPNTLTIGWLDGPNPDAEAIYRHLAQRNAINMYARSNQCKVVYSTHSDDELSAMIHDGLARIEHGDREAQLRLPAPNGTTSDTTPPRRALLLVGSPRTRKSTSASLGGYLMEQLENRGIETRTIQIYTSLNSPQRMEELFAALDETDLVVLAFPLYVDSLPAPVMMALERIAARRTGASPRPGFTTIANCGFPEAGHNATALAICAEFARQAGFEWKGGLALGGGEGRVHGTPLAEIDGHAIPIRGALEMAAEALAGGHTVPVAARDLLAKPVVPAWLYRYFGGWGWKQRAKRYGAQNRLRARPY